MWAKADMVATVAFSRLSLPFDGRDAFRNQRRYIQRLVGDDQLSSIRRCVAAALGIVIER